MSGMDGFAVLERVKEIDRNVNVIMITASEDKNSIVKAKKLGASDYITKPLDLENLYNTLSTYLEKE